MLASHRVTTIDVRPRKPISENEEVITCDAKAIDAPDETFDCVVSLCAIEHFGLGRYGDEFDLYAGRKAMAEIKRVLKRGGPPDTDNKHYECPSLDCLQSSQDLLA
jgi:ubiquinone/menaquinone biosynthesis C-methylase UbiE